MYKSLMTPDLPDVSLDPQVPTKNGCNGSIHIEQCGDVHIHTCAPPPRDCPCTTPDQQTGACIPVVAGAKHKLGRKMKISQLAGSVRVPSAMASATLHMARRFVRGKSPANALETAAFPVLERISRDMLSCTVDAFDAIPTQQRKRLFAESLMLDPDEPVTEPILVSALAQEIKERAALQAFGDPKAAEQERPGKIRVFPPSGEIPPNQVRICRINGIRTSNFVPLPPIGDFLPTEFHQDCAPIIVNGQPQVVCQVRINNCPGNMIHSTACARVLEVSAGDSMTLQGVNYFSTDTKVRITNRDTGETIRDIDAHVWGDVDTPVTEEVNGNTVLINDCRVQDRLTFVVPQDLVPGTYQIQVFVPNITGMPVFGEFLNSDGEFIQVMTPPTARFQIVTEKIIARRETSPSSFGSDEVGLQAIAFPLFADGTFGDPQEEKFKDIRDLDFDSGTSRDITRLVFTHDQPVLGMALSVAGFEIDSERAFNQLITSRMDFFIDLVKQQAKFISAGVAAAGGLAALTKLGAMAGWIAGIAAAVTLAVDVIVALWAPADPIIRDSFGFSAIDLDRLTSATFPAPPPFSFESEGDGGISVNVNKTIPPEKLPLQYRETREYVSTTEDSRYEITYRFNRLA
ncbi:MAG: hypothetical protein ACRD7E_22955 [Bryobacteraceae bacterium]